MKLLCSALGREEHILIGNSGHDLPVSMVPLVFSFMAYVIGAKPIIDRKDFFKRNLGLFFILASLVFLILDLYHLMYSGSQPSLEFFFQYLWIGLGLFYCRLVKEKGRFHSVIAYTTVACCVVISLSLLWTYGFVLPLRDSPSFLPFRDIPPGHVHQASFLMALGSFVLFILPRKKWLPVWGLTLTAGLFMLLILANFSRGAMVCLTLVLGIFIFQKLLSSGRSSLWTLVVLLGLAVALFRDGRLENFARPYLTHLSMGVGGTSADEFKTGKEHSAQLRLMSTKYALEGFMSSPVLGVGADLIPRYYDQSVNQASLSHTHFILVLAGYGLLGFIPVLLIGFFLLKFNRFHPRTLAVFTFLFCLQLFFPHFEMWFGLPLFLDDLGNKP